MKDYIPTYQECLDLVYKHDCFYKKTEMVNNTPITSFTYRIANYSDFCNTGAINMRGITFNSNTEKLIALPFWKFFNYGENPFTEPLEVNNWNISSIYEKLDGSLVYFYNINDQFHAKTKFNCMAPQAIESMEIVQCNEHLKSFIVNNLDNNYTPMFEYVSPTNRIVIPYNKQDLIYLGSRNMKTGELIKFNNENIKQPINYADKFKNIDDIVNYCGVSDKMEEGFVVHFNNTEIVKIKTRKYIDLHHTISSVTNEKYLASVILHEEMDDLISLLPSEFHEFVNNFKTKLVKHYNHIIHEATKFYELNKNLEQKQYALLALDTFTDNKPMFSIAMNLKTEKFNEDKFKENYINNQLWK
jgi:T4 RnlA family RNA ligase